MALSAAMTSIGYLIPEFPGQTHAFFMRERNELQQRGVHPVLISTRSPVAGAAQHAWAVAAAAETTYLTPLTIWSAGAAAWELLTSGPRAWLRCLHCVLSTIDVGWSQRVRIACIIPLAALLVRRLRHARCAHIHIHSCANSAWLGVFVRQLSNITYSLTLHGPLKDYGPGQSVKWHHARFVVIITQELLEQARGAIVSHSLPPLLLAPMGVELTQFSRCREYAPATRRAPVQLVSCGRLNPCKGHDDLIRAVDILRQRGISTYLNICGGNDAQKSDYREELQRLINELNLDGHVKLLGSVSEDRVRETLEAAHIFCLASHREPLGVATMEAMALHMPVVVTASPGVEEMITSGINGILVTAHQPEQMATAIESLLNNPDAAIQLGRAARRTIESRFHSGVSAEVIIRGINLEESP